MRPAIISILMGVFLVLFNVIMELISRGPVSWVTIGIVVFWSIMITLNVRKLLRKPDHHRKQLFILAVTQTQLL